MTTKTYRTCQHCGVENLNKDYCQHCGELININLKRSLEREQRAEEKRSLENAIQKHRITVFFENVIEHENILVRYTARFFYSIWIIVLAIGSFLAWLVSFIAA